MSALDASQLTQWMTSWLTDALLLGTLLAGLTYLVVRAAGLRKQPTIELMLWAIVLLRFALPLGPDWSFSLASAADRVGTALTTTGIPESTTTEAMWTVDERTVANSAEFVPTQSQQFSWQTAVLGGYLAAVVSLFMLRWRRQIRLGRYCANLPLASEALMQEVRLCASRLGLRYVPDVRVSPRDHTTFITGLIKPVLVIPKIQLVRRDELETVIIHELAHLRRGDMYVRLLQWFVGTLLFFWPVVAWVNRRIDEARECACDDWALRHSGLSVSAYARCLLAAAGADPIDRLAHPTTCMAGRPCTIERRINMILTSPTRPTNRRTTGLLSVILIAAWASFALSGAVEAKPQTNDTNNERPMTDEGVKTHHGEVFDIVRTYEVADLNHNGKIEYWEKTAFIVGAGIIQRKGMLAEYPDADVDGNGMLTAIEIADYLRGVRAIKALKMELAKAHKELMAGMSEEEASDEIQKSIHLKQIAIYHHRLDAQLWLLEGLDATPPIEKLQKLRQVLMDHYGVRDDLDKKKVEIHHTLGEIKKKIIHIQAELADATEPTRIQKFEAHLEELERKQEELKEHLVKIEAELEKQSEKE